MIDANLALQAITAVAVAFTGYFTWRNNKLGHATSAKVDAVQGTAIDVSAKVDAVAVTQDGVGHALAASLADNQQQNQDLIRNLAAAGLVPPPSPSPPPPRDPA